MRLYPHQVEMVELVQRLNKPFQIGGHRVFLDVKGDPLLAAWSAFKCDGRVYRRDLPAAAASRRVDDALALKLISRGAAGRKQRRLDRIHANRLT